MRLRTVCASRASPFGRLAARTRRDVPAHGLNADHVAFLLHQLDLLGHPQEAPTVILPPPEPNDMEPADSGRQDDILRALRKEWILSNDGISPAMMAGLEALPKKWVERRLAELGEEWRRDSY